VPSAGAHPAGVPWRAQSHRPAANNTAPDFAWMKSDEGGLFRIDASQTGVKTSKIASLDKPTALAFAPDGTLWGTTWPDRKQVVRFNAQHRAELMLEFEADVVGGPTSMVRILEAAVD